MEKPRIAVLSFSNLRSDPRVRRQIEWLATIAEVTAIGYADPEVDGVRFCTVEDPPKSVCMKCVIAARLATRQFRRHYWSQLRVRQTVARLEQEDFDVIVANDIDALPVAIAFKKHAKVVFDAHEYAPKEHEDQPAWRLLFQRYKTFLCEYYIPLADVCLTVCQGLADEYKRVFGTHFHVMTNAPARSNLNPTEVSSPIKLVCHTAALPSRQIEKMLQAMDSVSDDFLLTLILVKVRGNEAYYDEVVRLASQRKNVQLRDAVPMDTIVETLHEFDVGVYLLPPVNFNHVHALPNKLFEFIQARLAVVIGPSPEMVRVVESTGCGRVAAAFTPFALSETIQSLSAGDIRTLKNSSHRAATQLCAENNRKIFIEACSVPLVYSGRNLSKG